MNRQKRHQRHQQQRQSTTTAQVVAHTVAPSVGVLRLFGPADEAAGERTAYPIDAEVTCIGRSLQNAVLLADPTVSREHARLTCLPDGWEIENISSSNGLFVGEREVPPGARASLQPGDIIRLGNSSLQLIAPRGVSPAASLSGRYANTAGDSSATNVFGPGVTLQFALSGRFSRSVRWALGLMAVGVFLAGAIITLGMAALVGQNTAAQNGIGRVLASIAIPLIPALGVAALVALLDRYEREPLLVLLGAFLWGALVAVPPTLFLERTFVEGLLDHLSVFGQVSGLEYVWTQALGAGVIEETAKGAGLLLLFIFLHDEFDNVTDGLIYALVIGAGFALVENFVYFAVVPRSDLAFLVIGRVVLGWLSHSTFTALLGAGLGYARETRDPHLRWRVPLLGFVGAIILHTIFDTVAFGADALAQAGIFAGLGSLFAVCTLLAEYAPLFTVQTLLLRLAMRSLAHEAAIVRDYLTPDVLAGAVTPDEYILAQDAALRTVAERHYAVTYGLRAYFTARALYQAAIGLAFRRWHVAMGDPPKHAPRQPEEAHRERIARLRRSLQRQLQVRVMRVGVPTSTGRNAEPTRPLVR